MTPITCPRFCFPITIWMASYQRLDLTSSYQANRYVSIEANAQNLLNEHYSEAFGYPSLPFMFRLGMKFTLGGESWPGK